VPLGKSHCTDGVGAQPESPLRAVEDRDAQHYAAALRILDDHLLPEPERFCRRGFAPAK
jgi:hypothetical protein